MSVVWSMLYHLSLFCCVSVFNETATPQTSTYLHTLSLLYSLPICQRHLRRLRAQRRQFCRHRQVLGYLRLPAGRLFLRAGRAHEDVDPGAGQSADRSADQRNRSEEHTSELQSLMRISYAVFCLKKQQLICPSLLNKTTKTSQKNT